MDGSEDDCGNWRGHDGARDRLRCGVGWYNTVLEDVSDSVLSRALGWIRETFEEGVKRAKVGADVRDSAVARISTSTRVEETIRDAELIIEAVPEELGMKVELFAIFAERAKPQAM